MGLPVAFSPVIRAFSEALNLYRFQGFLDPDERIQLWLHDEHSLGQTFTKWSNGRICQVFV